MATGRSNKLVGQTGEYLVAAELSRRGLIATTFTGNVPHYDIIASNEQGKHVSVQVKASRGSSWQFGDISHFCKISFRGKKQIVGAAKPCPVKRLVVVFVMIKPNGADRYYILTWRKLQNILVKGYKSYLAKHNGMRAQKWDSLHSAISEKHLKPHRDKWTIIERNLK
jgi:Holliday junction resolvase-like predicted endonuclease